jgi:hypothetical protein
MHKVLPTTQPVEDETTSTLTAKTVEPTKVAADAEAERVWKQRYEEAQ